MNSSKNKLKVLWIVSKSTVKFINSSKNKLKVKIKWKIQLIPNAHLISQKTIYNGEKSTENKVDKYNSMLSYEGVNPGK